MQLVPPFLTAVAVIAIPALANDLFKFSGSAELDYVYTDNGKKGDPNNKEFALDRALLLNIEGAKPMNNDWKMGYLISQRLASGHTKRENQFGSREAYVFLSSPTYGTIKGGRLFSNSYLVLDWPFAQTGCWPVAEVGVGKVTGGGEDQSFTYVPNSVSYELPTLGGRFGFKIQHGWGNEKHSRDSMVDLSGTAAMGTDSTVYGGFLMGRPTVNIPITPGDPESKKRCSNDIRDMQVYLGASIAVNEPLTLRGLIQAYKREEKDTRINGGKEFSLGATYKLGTFGYLQAAHMNQNNSGDRHDFIRTALQYGHFIGGGAECYFRATEHNHKIEKKIHQFLVGVYVEF